MACAADGGMTHRRWNVATAALTACLGACADGSMTPGAADASVQHARTVASHADASAASCLTCLPPVDAGAWPSSEQTRADAAAAANGCRTSARPACAAVPCTWAEAQPKLPPCATPPRASYFAARCGAYDALVEQGTDSQQYFLYDVQGRLVAINHRGLDAYCEAFEPAFVVPDRCTTVTPKCAQEPAGDAG